MATTVSQPGYFNLQALTDLGALAVGGRIYTFASGTTTKKNAYTEATGTTVHTYTTDSGGVEYIALNARGELPAPLYLTSGAYDITYKTSAGATVWTRRADPVGDASLAYYLPDGTGAVSRTVQSKLRESVSVKDFGAVGDGVADDTTALLAAIAYINANAPNVNLFFPAGDYLVTSSVLTPALGGRSCFTINVDGWSIQGAGRDSTRILFNQTSGGSARLIDILDCDHWSISDLSIEDANTPVSAAGTVLSRAINGRNNSHFQLKNLSVKNVQSYAFGHQEGPFVDGLWSNIRIENCGNDGIDIKNIASGVYAGNRELVIENITGINIGMFLTDAPNVLVDMRGSGVIDGVFTHIVNDETYAVRISEVGEGSLGGGTGSQRTMVSNVIVSGSSILSADQQFGVIIACEDVHVSNVVAKGLYIGVEVVENVTSEGRGSLSGAIIMDCDIGLVAGADGFRVINTSFVDNGQGIEITAPTTVIGCDFSGASQLTMDLSSTSGGSQIVGNTNINSTAANVAVAVRGSITAIGNTGFGSSLESEGLTTEFSLCNAAPKLTFRDASGAVKGRISHLTNDIDINSGSGTTDRYRIRTAGGSGGAQQIKIDNVDSYTFAAGYFRPEVDNTQDLGSAAKRWAIVYAGTGAINTSDAREKQQVRTLSEQERAVSVRLKGLIRAFKFNNAVDQKGDAARIHIGVMAQDVRSAFEAEGLIAENYAMFCHDKWDDEFDDDGNVVTQAGERYGLRYEELLAFVISAM